MFKVRFFLILWLLIILIFSFNACTGFPIGSREDGQRIAEKFARVETTFKFDGIQGTLKTTWTNPVIEGWKYTIEFDSRHPGYGNRRGQILAEEITHHSVEITVQGRSVTMAIMDRTWDMINQHMLEIKLAPIHEVEVIIMERPKLVRVYVKGGLQDGCTTFRDFEVSQEDRVINIEITTQRPEQISCPAIYSYFEQYIELGDDFNFNTNYTVNVNDYETSFYYQ